MIVCCRCEALLAVLKQSEELGVFNVALGVFNVALQSRCIQRGGDYWHLAFRRARQTHQKRHQGLLQSPAPKLLCGVHSLTHCVPGQCAAERERVGKNAVVA